MIKLSVQEAENRFASLLTAVEAQGEVVVICRNGKAVAELRPSAADAGPLRVHPELSRVRFFEDPTKPLDEEDWPESAR